MYTYIMGRRKRGRTTYRRVEIESQTNCASDTAKRLPRNINMTPRVAMQAERNIRARYTACTGVQNPRVMELALFTRQEQIDKYAKEYAFWSYEGHMKEMPDNAIEIAEKTLAASAHIKTMSHIKQKYIDDEEMLAEIYHTSIKFHLEYYGEEMDNLMSLMFRVDERKI